MPETKRSAGLERRTTETAVSLSLNLDGAGNSRIKTGIPFFDHMMTLFSRHGLIDLELAVDGDVEVDYHHTVEDSGIVLGECLRTALGDKTGIARYGHAYVPMDEALSRVVVDLSNRPWLEFRAPADTPDAQNFPFSLVEEFCRALASNLRANIHVEVLYGRDGHHIAESVFKGLAKAIRIAASVDPRVTGIPSTKETL
jgi:imidazoleglycerol-phosphate dehydratase